jgi:hypothetical protein
LKLFPLQGALQPAEEEEVAGGQDYKLFLYHGITFNITIEKSTALNKDLGGSPVDATQVMEAEELGLEHETFRHLL